MARRRARWRGQPAGRAVGPGRACGRAARPGRSRSTPTGRAPAPPGRRARSGPGGGPRGVRSVARRAARGRQHAGLRGAVEVGGGLVEEQQRRVAQPGPRQGDTLALAGREPGPAVAQRVSDPLRQPPTTSVRPTAPARRATSASPASGRPSRTLSATERAKRWGRCGTQARWRRLARSRSASGDAPSRTVPASGGHSPRTTASTVDFPHPLGAVEGHRSPGSTTSPACSRAGTLPSRVRHLRAR